MKIRNLLLIVGSILAVAATPVLADLNYTQGSGSIIFDFICFSTKHCSGHVPINSAGTEIATSGNPLRVDPTGTTTQPVSAASLPLPTGAASSANQGTTADAPCTVPTSATACSEIAIAKAIANVANSATPLGAARIGYITDDPCNNASTKVYTPISIVTATSTVVSTGVAAKKKYICALMLYPAAADNVAIIQATTATACATAPAGLIGGATAATGIIATAQAGFVIGTGSAAVAATTINQTDICLITSAAVQLSGVLVTVDQ